MNVFRRCVGRQCGKPRVKRLQGCNLNAFGLALLQGRRNEVPVIGQSDWNKLRKLGRVFRLDIVSIIAKIGPNLFFGRTCAHHANKVQQKAERDRWLPAWDFTIVDMVHGVAQALFNRLFMPLRPELEIFVNRFGDYAQVQLLCAFGFAKGVKGNAVFGAIFQPVFKREAIALGLGNLLALLVEEHFVN